jgi:hypothetical protein
MRVSGFAANKAQSLGIFPDSIFPDQPKNFEWRTAHPETGGAKG